jgi:hypothetical protein
VSALSTAAGRGEKSLMLPVSTIFRLTRSPFPNPAVTSALCLALSDFAGISAGGLRAC